MDTIETVYERPGAWKLFRIWGKIGLQSFGGGATTSLLIQRNFIDINHWMTMEDFTRYWSLCVFTPGINLVALTVLIGRRLGGTRGIVASLVGMLLPSAFITCLLTAGFQLIQHDPNVQAVLRGVIPATAGIMLLVGLNFAYPLIKQAYEEGLVKLGASVVIILACAVAIILFKLSVIPVLLTSAVVSMLVFTSWRVKAIVQQGIEQEEGEPVHD
jgi:chromate transporter